MLASLGRVAAQRLAPRRIATSSAGYIVRVGRLAAHQPNRSSALVGAAFTKRTYVAGRPKKTAAGSTAPATATKAKAKPRKTTAAAAAPTKKAAPKKKTTTAKAAASKTKKKKPAARPRKVLSPEEKTARREQKAKQKLIAQKKLLKEQALLNQEPKKLPSSPWMVFFTEALTPPNPGERVVSQMAKIGETFRTLSSAEMQRLESIAEQNRRQNTAQYKAWVASHSPAQIAEAIRARKLLKSKFDLPKARKSWERIFDDRQPKRPITPYLHFSRSRYGAGNRGDGSVTDMQKENAQLWNKMSPAEQQPFKDLAEADKARYFKEADALGTRRPTA